MTDRRERVRALFLCTLVVLSVLSGPIAFSGPVAAATNASFSVANDAPGATTTLTAELDRESTGDSVGKLELNLSGSGASFSDQSSDYTVEVINPDGTTQDSLKDGNDISLSTSNGRETATLSFSQPDGGVDVGDTIRIEASGFTNPGSSGTYTGNYVINPDSTPKSVSASIDIGDTTKPTVTSITRSSPTSRIIQNGPVDFKVQFSEPVSNVGTDDF
ncbi:MAG: surface glycoprotein, partial [Salinirussus sp.]